MIRSILVPLDGSPFGEHALPTAAALARRAGATLHLAHVHQASVPLTPAGIVIHDSFDLDQLRGEQSYLADVAGRVTAGAPLPVEKALLEGDVVLGLKTYAERHSIDLVVMSTHARGAFARFWLGSIADDLAHEIPQPILLVPPADAPTAPEQEPTLRSIVVPLDGSALAEKILGPAEKLCRLFGAELHLIRVNRPVALPGQTLGRSGSLEQLLEEMACEAERELDEARTYLAQIAAGLIAKGVKVHTRAVIGREPVSSILTEAKGDRADLIAMQTHGRRGLARLFMGSVADGIVKGGVPVLLHHTAG